MLGCLLAPLACPTVRYLQAPAAAALRTVSPGIAKDRPGNKGPHEGPRQMGSLGLMAWLETCRAERLLPLLLLSCRTERRSRWTSTWATWTST